MPHEMETSRYPRARYVVESQSTEQQEETEDEVEIFFVDLTTLPESQLTHLRQGGLVDGFRVCLLRDKHVRYLTKALEQPLNANYVSLDSSRPWMVYWTLHSLDLLDALPSCTTLERIVDTLRRCWCPKGGYGGGPQQLGHTAPTYAAVLALTIVAGAQKCVDGPVPPRIRLAARDELSRVRPLLYKWFISLRQPLGNLTGFCVNEDGEVDVRGTYTVISVCALLNLLTEEILQGAVEYGKCLKFHSIVPSYLV